MNLTNNVVHAVVGETFVMGLHDLENDDTIVKSWLLKMKMKFVILIIFLIQ